MREKGKKGRFSPKAPAQSLNPVSNDSEEWDIIESDVLGSYTGIGSVDGIPEQDADDL